MSPSQRAVLIAIDASPQSLAALETAAKVASRLDAELRGMYVEDVDLLRIAELPFACAISSLGELCALTPDMMEGQLRHHADKARNAVEAAGNRCNVAWSFSVARGTVHREIERAASTADLVAVGRCGWSAATGHRLGSVARSLLEAGATSLLMAGQGGIQQPLAVFYDGSASADRALALAIALDGRAAQPIRIIVMSDGPSLERRVTELLKDAKANAKIEIQPEDTRNVLTRLRAPQVKTLLIPTTLLSRALESVVILDSNLTVFLIK
jgi:nucleotide-binding universal stress UspA family protein